MPDFTFSFTVRGITQQRATTIGTRIEQRLGEDNVDVSGVNVARITIPFRVLSVDIGTREVFDEIVETTSEQAARSQVESATRVVAKIGQAL